MPTTEPHTSIDRLTNLQNSKENCPSAELQTKNTDRLNHLTLHPQTKTLAIRANKSALNGHFVCNKRRHITLF